MTFSTSLTVRWRRKGCAGKIALAYARMALGLCRDKTKDWKQKIYVSRLKCIHWFKTVEPKLNNVLQAATKIVNYIKSLPLNIRLFSLLCQERGFEHESKVAFKEQSPHVCLRLRCISSSQVFFSLAHYLTDSKWMASLAYLAGKLNTLTAIWQTKHTELVNTRPQQQYPDPLRENGCFHKKVAALGNQTTWRHVN